METLVSVALGWRATCSARLRPTPTVPTTYLPRPKHCRYIASLRLCDCVPKWRPQRPQPNLWRLQHDLLDYQRYR